MLGKLKEKVVCSVLGVLKFVVIEVVKLLAWVSLAAQLVMNPPAQDLGLIPRLERSPGGNSYPLQYSGLENSWGPK